MFKLNARHLIAFALVAAAIAILYHLSPELGAGALVLANAPVGIAEIKSIIEDQGKSLDEFKAGQAKKVDDLAAHMDQIEAKLNRTALGGGGTGGPKPKVAHLIDTKSKRLVPVLGAGDSLAEIDGKKADEVPSIGRVLRGLVLGGKADDAKELAEERKALSIDADPAGGYTVAGALSSRWIDLLRARMVLAQAGAPTIPMDTGSLTLARLTGDPAVAWHKENASIDDSAATFGAVSLNAKTVVCLVKMSLELAQDSANIEQMLQTSITNAMAGAIDSAGLVGVSVGAAGAPGGIYNLSGRNTVTSIGAPTNWDWCIDAMAELLYDNVPAERIGAMIGHPKIWTKMRKLKTGISSDQTPLPAPAEVAALPKLWTTAAPLAGGNTAKAVLGDWADYYFGVRKSITLRVLGEAFLGSNLQIGVLAYARVDFQAVRADSFVTAEGITV